VTHRKSLFRLGLALLVCLLFTCTKRSKVGIAFYYWKSDFNLNSSQSNILYKAAKNNIYIRFFDINWDDKVHKAYPNALISFKQPTNKLKITPVIYISNKTFENINSNDIDSLAINSAKLLNELATLQKIRYQDIQIDCDWTISTKDKYFSFLRSFEKISHRNLEVTIRLHQVKYKETTGVPPVGKGVLMFYNMGKLNADVIVKSSIYNKADAGEYVAYLPGYPLKLDVALPLFSWSIHIRDGRVIQVYEKIKSVRLNKAGNFKRVGNLYTAKKSFFLSGIYVKENDIFKVEETDLHTLQNAAQQLAESLPHQNDRTIIYYELSNLDPTEFSAEAILKVSDRF